MALKFEPIAHKYTSIDPTDTTVWTSVTQVLSKLKEHFDAKSIADKSSRKKIGKYAGLTSDEIQEIWKKESDRACNLGNWYHDQREKDILSCETMVRHDSELPVITPMEQDGVKIASSQKLINGIYPEHMVYLRSCGLCGQSDLVEVVDGQVHIIDYKTNKEIKKNSFVNYEGISKKMMKPVQHLEDCNFNHYNLQLSIYMYMILKHNPNLKPGKLIIQHVVFEDDGQDKYGYPITKLSSTGEPIVKEVVKYEMPYLKQEVIDIMNWMTDAKKLKQW